MPDFKQIDDLILEWEAAWRAGQSVTPQQLCPDWPEGQAELGRRAELLRQFEAFSAGEESTVKYSDATEPPPAIPGYTIRGKLGEGGMGVVYRAWQEALGREVAVKVMRGGPNIPSHVTKRFAQEARLLAQLQHDHLVPIYDAKLHLGQPYFVMELVQGGCLKDALARFADDPRSAVELVEVVARVVHYAHEQGVLHRDLKPANILLDKQGRPRVSDFGLAKLYSDGTSATEANRQRPGLHGTATLSAGNGVMGTPPYMAPEQFQGDAAAMTPRTDVWGLGVILYELLTGKRPFTGAEAEDFALSDAPIGPLPPRSIRPKLDPDLEAIVLKCLRKEPLERYATAMGVADDLAAWKRGDFPTVSRASPQRRFLRHVRRRPVLLAGAIFVAPLVAMLVVTFCLTQFGTNSSVTFSRPTIPADPDLVLKDIEGRLAIGETVELIGKTGPPKWFRAAEGGKRTHTFLADDGTFSVDSYENLCLLELVQDPQRDRYTITAKIRHEKSDDLGEVGIYCGRYAFDFDGAQVSTFTYLGYSDIVSALERYNRKAPAEQARMPRPTGNVVLFPFRLVGRREGKVIADDVPFSRDRANWFTPAWPQRAGWRTLVVKMGLEGIEGYWEGEEYVNSIPIEGLAELADKALLQNVGRQNGIPGLQQMRPTFPRRGGLGLYVRNSAASFCSVTVEK